MLNDALEELFHDLSHPYRDVKNLVGNAYTIVVLKF